MPAKQATKSQKRIAPEGTKSEILARARTAKKARANVVEAAVNEDPTMKAIEDTIEQAENLSQTCRSMLITGIRSSLNTVLDERHEVQVSIVGMVDEVICAAQASLQDALDLAKVAEANCESTKANLASNLSAIEAVLADRSRVVEEKTCATAGAGEKMAEAVAEHAEKLAVQQKGDVAMMELQENRAAVERGIEKDLKAITEGEADSTEILATLQKLSFDESLIKALPGTCARAPADRGSFDGMVLDQLETSLTQKLADLSKTIEDEVPGAKERADAVDAALEQVSAAISCQANAAEEQTTAEASRCEASVAVDAAKATLAAHELEEIDALHFRQEKLVVLDAFRANTLVPFQMLRDRRSSTMTDVTIPEAKVTDPSPADSAAPMLVGGA